MNNYRVKVIEHQWGGFDADFILHVRADSEDAAMQDVKGRCSAWEPVYAVQID